MVIIINELTAAEATQSPRRSHRHFLVDFQILKDFHRLKATYYRHNYQIDSHSDKTQLEFVLSKQFDKITLQSKYKNCVGVAGAIGVGGALGGLASALTGGSHGSFPDPARVFIQDLGSGYYLQTSRFDQLLSRRIFSMYLSYIFQCTQIDIFIPATF